jgi:integrase
MLAVLENRQPVLVDKQGLPRYWAAVWALLHTGGLASSTVLDKLRHIEAVYDHAHSIDHELDDALANLDFEALSEILESYFVTLRNVPKPTQSALIRWNTAFHFVRDTCERLERNPEAGNKMSDIRLHIERLDRLYLGLRPFRKRLGTQVRAIPKFVLLEILDAATPGSSTNPFQRQETQWRVFAIVTILLFQGLRRGEMLSLTADFLKPERDQRNGTYRWRMSVRTNEAEDDSRATRPSIKTTQSIRSIPVTNHTAEGLLAYAENFRGSVNHSLFLSSTRGLPLSIEGVTKALHKLTEALSKDARAELKDVTGAVHITAHALRHTCAVVRMKQMLHEGASPEQAMAQMRSFFGWSRTSLMPMHYAKAALDERLNESWNDALDERLAILRSLPQ